jgi:hypothetical protein
MRLRRSPIAALAVATASTCPGRRHRRRAASTARRSSSATSGRHGRAPERRELRARSAPLAPPPPRTATSIASPLPSGRAPQAARSPSWAARIAAAALENAGAHLGEPPRGCTVAIAEVIQAARSESRLPARSPPSAARARRPPGPRSATAPRGRHPGIITQLLVGERIVEHGEQSLAERRFGVCVDHSTATRSASSSAGPSSTPTQDLHRHFSRCG